MDEHALTVKTVRDGLVCVLILAGDFDYSGMGGFLVQAALAVDAQTERLVLDLAPAEPGRARWHPASPAGRVDWVLRRHPGRTTRPFFLPDGGQNPCLTRPSTARTSTAHPSS